MKFAPVARFAWRESRGSRGRLVFFCACLVIGVAAVTGVSSVVSSFDEGLRSRSRELLAADMAIDGRRPLPEAIDALMDELAPNAERSDVREMATLVSREATTPDADSRSLLVELKVVAGRYPLYGSLKLDPDQGLGDILDEESIVVGRELLQSLGMKVGDPLRIGGTEFTIKGIVVDEPDRLDFSLTLGPRIFLTDEGLARTSLLGFGSRVRYRTLYRLEGEASREQLDTLKGQLQERLPRAEYYRFEHHYDAQPTVRQLLNRIERFMGLVALLSLVLGGIGVAQITRAWLASRIGDTAVLRCLGCRPREVFILYVAHVLFVALIGSVIGASLGALLPWILTVVSPDLFGADLALGFRFGAWVQGTLLGLGIALVFSLPALASLYRVPPSRVLRHEAEPLPLHRPVFFGSWLILIGGLFFASWIQSGRPLEAAWFSGGLTGVTLALYFGAWGLMRLSSYIPREKLPPWLVHGFASLSRPGAGTTGAVVALGLGVTVVAAMSLIENRLEQQIQTALPDDAPSAFFVDVQPDQWDGIRGALEDRQAKAVQSVPVVMARISAVDGRPVKELLEERKGEKGRPRWVLTREQRLTWLDEMPENNTIREGTWWSEESIPEMSLEIDYARDLGASLGSVVTFDVQGVTIDLKVTSLRHVEWQSFALNFFVVVRPGLLEQAPYFRIAAARLEETAEQPFQDELAQGYPNVTMLRVRPILEKLLALMGQIALGVRVLGSLTILAGIVILAGAVSANSHKRSREVALLKTLGVTRARIVTLFSVEYALCGLLAGVVGGVAAWILSWQFIEKALELSADLSLWSLPWIPLASALLSVLAGLGASSRAFRVRPTHCLQE